MGQQEGAGLVDVGVGADGQGAAHHLRGGAFGIAGADGAAGDQASRAPSLDHRHHIPFGVIEETIQHRPAQARGIDRIGYSIRRDMLGIRERGAVVEDQHARISIANSLRWRAIPISDRERAASERRSLK